MVYEWGTPVTYVTLTEVTKDYEAKVGEIMKHFCQRRYERDAEMGVLEFEQKSALAIVDKMREEGHEPYYVKCEVIDLYFLYPKWIYDVEVTINMKILKASPIPWGAIASIILLGMAVALALYLITIPVEIFWKIITGVGEAIGTALGLPAGAGTGLLVIGGIIVVILILVLFITRR
ncbi:MAG: hypothetical protein H3Z54_09490 [archaeon]|nr:hypothetical protein [archaeon]